MKARFIFFLSRYSLAFAYLRKYPKIEIQNSKFIRLEVLKLQKLHSVRGRLCWIVLTRDASRKPLKLQQLFLKWPYPPPIFKKKSPRTRCTGCVNLSLVLICISVTGLSPYNRFRPIYNQMLTYPSNDGAILINDQLTNIWEIKCTSKNGCIWKRKSIRIKSKNNKNRWDKIGGYTPVLMFVNSTFFDAQDK